MKIDIDRLYDEDGNYGCCIKCGYAFKVEADGICTYCKERQK